MSNLIDIAKEYLRQGLSVIPTRQDKLPALASWKPYQSFRLNAEEVEALFSGGNVKGLAIICGAISGDLEVIDVDTKYDNTGSLWEEFRGLIETTLPEIYSRLVIAQTKSGGYHLYYRCSTIEGNQTFAKRETTPEEREATYKKEIIIGATKEDAKRRSLNDKVRVLIETRGEGGYVIAPPTTGYTYIQGEPGVISTISSEDREILFNIAKSFNELEEIKPKVNKTIPTTYSSTGLSPFDDYNQRGDLVEFLESKGWRVVNQQGKRINVLRPGDTDSKNSGNYHTELRLLRVFSSSTDFNPEKAYNNSQVFSLLECKGDFKKASKLLYEMGYGERYQITSVNDAVKKERIKTVKMLNKVEAVNFVSSVNSINKEAEQEIRVEYLTDQEKAYIYKTAKASPEEVYNTLLKIEGSIEAEVYVKDVDSLSATEEVKYTQPGHEYKLYYALNKYSPIEEQKGFLEPEDIDALLKDVVSSAAKLKSSIERDRFIHLFISIPQIKNYGITDQSIKETVTKIRELRLKKEREEDVKGLIDKAATLTEEGSIDEAIKLLVQRGRKLSKLDKGASIDSLLEIPTEEDIRKEAANKTENIPSGYTLSDGVGKAKELKIPSGALSIVAARTSHRKSCMMMNLAINVARNKEIDGEVYYFTYEESREDIIYKLLNIDIHREEAANKLEQPDNINYIEGYFRNPSGYKNDFFLKSKDSFFNELIYNGRLRISYPNLETQSLCMAIEQLKERAKPVIIFIDYIQQLRIDGSYNTKQLELQEICEQLRETAIATKLPIVLGAQLNRFVGMEAEIDSSKIREAGDIEQTANLVLGLWDRAFTKQDGNDKDRKGNKAKHEPGTLYVEVLKGRGMGTGAYGELPYNGNTWRIRNYERDNSPF